MSRTGRISTWLPGKKATAPSRSTVKPPLTLLKMTPVTFSPRSNCCSRTRPALFAASLLAAQHRLTEGVLHTLQVDLDLVPNLEVGGLARSRKLLQRHPAFHLQADVNDGHVLLDRDDLAADDVAFVDDVLGKSFIQHGRELFAGRRQLIRDLRCAHQVSFRSVGRPPPTGF